MLVSNKLCFALSLVFLAGSPVFGALQKHCHKNAPIIIKKKRKKVEIAVKSNREEAASPELFLSSLCVNFDPEIKIQENNEKYKKIEEEQARLPEITAIQKINFNDILLLKNGLEKINLNHDGNGAFSLGFSRFNAFVKNVYFDGIAKGLKCHSLELSKTAVSQADSFYCVSWCAVCDWLDIDNYNRVEKCGYFAKEYSSRGIYDDVDRHEFFKLIKGQYKIHIMPKDKEEGIRVVSLLLYLLKNNNDFRKYAYGFKFLMTFSLDVKDHLGQIIPVFVIYPVWGKKNAQNVLNIVALALKQIEFIGSPIVPRYNFTTGMQGLTAAMGDADFKPNSLFDKTKNYSVCKNAKNQNQEHFELTLASLT